MADWDPELRTRWLRGESLLAAGDFAQGYRLVDAAWRERYPDQWLRLPLPAWAGEDVAEKRILVSGEQGFGDQIMFARFALILQRRGAFISWRCARPLRRLFSASFGFEALGLEEMIVLDPFAFHIPSGQLPLHFFPPLTEPPPEPYLTPPPTKRSGRIGVVTKGNPANYTDRFRTLPPQHAAELMALPGAMSLEPEDTGAADFYETAAVIAGLDLVITVDTAVAHLAGAMGKPVWILLSSEWTDPRWQEGRSDSPWYPSARLFRQQTAGDWAQVLHEVREALRAL